MVPSYSRVCWHAGANITKNVLIGLAGFVALCVIIIAFLLIRTWKKRSSRESNSLRFNTNATRLNSTINEKQK